MAEIVSRHCFCIVDLVEEEEEKKTTLIRFALKQSDLEIKFCHELEIRHRG